MLTSNQFPPATTTLEGENPQTARGWKVTAVWVQVEPSCTVTTFRPTAMTWLAELPQIS